MASTAFQEQLTARTSFGDLLEQIGVSSSNCRLAYSDTDLDELGVLSRSSRYRLRRQGKFPEPVTAGGRNLYRATDIHAWLEDPDSWTERGQS